tara:strand:- start:5856 stop:7448 length:1593 start_codon:yes stop_codon:yes gene_type:complete
MEEDDGNITAHCFACKTNVPDPYHDKPEGYKPPKPKKITDEEIREKLEEIAECGFTDIPSRRLRKDVLQYFGVRVGVDQSDGKTPSAAYLPYYKDGELVRVKVRLLQRKTMWSYSLDTDVDLFGWEQAVKSGARRLIITEGEFDAIALTKMLEIYTPDKWKENMPAVVSVPNGSATASKDIARLLPKIRRHFKDADISLCFDDDDAGQSATEDVLKIIPLATVVTLPYKDANECLIKGAGKKAYQSTTFNADKAKNTKLVWGHDLHEEAKVPAEYGLSWPWPRMTKLTRGIRFGETVYIGAAQKMGKSEVVNTLAGWLIKEHGLTCLLAKPEEANKKSYKLLAGKMEGKVFHDPDVVFDGDAYDRAGELLQDKLLLLNLYQHVGWESLKVDIIAAVGLGVKAVFIDPITNLTNGLESGAANTKLQEIAQELAAMAKDLDIVIFIFCHLNNPTSGEPHDRGGAVLTSQFAGSRAMGRSSNYMIALQGNKNPELSEEERNTRDFIILDDREFGQVGGPKLYWDPKTQLFNQM